MASASRNGGGTSGPFAAAPASRTNAIATPTQPPACPGSENTSGKLGALRIVCMAPTSPILRACPHIARRINGDARRHAGTDAVLVVLLVAEAEANRQAL